MARCSLSYTEFNSIDFASGRLASPLSHLTGLSLSISDLTIEQQSLDVTTPHGLQSLLQTCPNLQNPNLTHYWPGSNSIDPTIGRCDTLVLRALAATNLPHIHTLTLQGFETHEKQLLTLLQNSLTSKTSHSATSGSQTASSAAFSTTAPNT